MTSDPSPAVAVTGAVESAVLPQVRDVRVEHRREALGIGSSRPRLSWRYADGACVPPQVEVEARGADRVERMLLPGADQVLRPWPFTPLRSRRRFDVRVRAVASTPDGRFRPGEWSEAIPVEAGLLDPRDWSARMIGLQSPQGHERDAIVFRRGFTVPAGTVHRARLYLTGWGTHSAHLNGTRIGNERLAPGWTSYHHRLVYRTHDLTDLLRAGDNTIEITVADGWYRGRLGWDRQFTDVYGDRSGVLAQLEVDVHDQRLVVATDPFWTATRSAIRAASLYDGEVRDERSTCDDTLPIQVLDLDRSTLTAPTAAPVRPTESLRPVAVREIDKNVVQLDFGQNLAGVLQARVRGPEGATVMARHAETLDADGRLATRPLRTARATDRITLGAGEVLWQPEFTVHGFRFAELEVDDGAQLEDVQAVVLHTDMDPTGSFECSDPELTRLWENARWSLRGNAVSLPTDCPQRDERLGWTGDIAVFAAAATGLYDCAGFLTSWLEDLRAEQVANNGVPPLIVPSIAGPTPPAALWGDAAVVVPWTLYERYGDLQVVRESWTSMTAWVDAVSRRLDDDLIWRGDAQYGDWLDPCAPPDDPAAARTPADLVATAWHTRSADLVSRAASALGLEEEAARYRSLAQDVAAAFRTEYVTPAGRLSPETQTAYATALAFGLLPQGEARTNAAARLVHLVERDGYRIQSGFAGTPFILDALTEHGHGAVAHRMLTETNPPSYRYQVRNGATTIWERWDSVLPDGTLNPGEMTSLNHYAYGAVADWLQRVVGGIAPLQPGYRTIAVRPVPGGALTWARTTLLTPYGKAACAWHVEDNTFRMTVHVPLGTQAEATLPDGTVHHLGPGRHDLATSHLIEAAPIPSAPEPPGIVLARQRPVQPATSTTHPEVPPRDHRP